MEITSTVFEEVEATNCVSEMRNASEKAASIAKSIGQLKIELNELLTVCNLMIPPSHKKNKL